MDSGYTALQIWWEEHHKQSISMYQSKLNFCNITCLHAEGTTAMNIIKASIWRQVDLPRVSFSTSLLQRCKQPSSTLSSSSVMWRGAGCMGRSGGSRDWVKGLWMGTLCCWAAAGAAVGPEAGPELSRGGKESCSAMLQGGRDSI